MKSYYEFEGKLYQELDKEGSPRKDDIVLDLLTNRPDRVIAIQGNAILLEKSQVDNGTRYKDEIRILKET